MKGLKDMGMLGRQYPDAIVDDTDDGAFSLGHHIQFEAWRTSCVGQAVVDQVVKDSTDLAGVGIHGHRLRSQCERDVRPAQLDAWPCSIRRLSDGFAKIQVDAPCWRASANEASTNEARLRLTLNACRVTIFSSNVSDANGPTPFTAAHTAITEAMRAAGAAPASRNRHAAIAISGRTRYSSRNWF